jgi:hypothetical protein
MGLGFTGGELLLLASADASERDIVDLLSHTDRVAEIPSSLRCRTPVSLAQSKAITRKTPELQKLETGN